MYNNNYNASSRDYNDMSRNASREFDELNRALIARRENEAKKKMALAIEKANILKELELGLIDKEEALNRIKALEQEEPKKHSFFR